MRPYRSRQYEVGVKYDNAGIPKQFGSFQITKPSGAIGSTDNIFNANSEQRNRGVEVNLSAQVLDNLQISGNLSLIDAELIKSLLHLISVVTNPLAFLLYKQMWEWNMTFLFCMDCH